MAKKRKLCGRKNKIETTSNKKIKIEFPSSPQMNTVIKEEINVYDDNSFPEKELSPSPYVDHPIKNECTFDEHEDGLWTLGFPGFSSYECESTKAKAVIMQELRFDVREKNPTVEVMVEGNKNITCTQKIMAKKRKLCGRKNKIETTSNKKIKIEFPSSPQMNTVIKEEINVYDDNSFPEKELSPSPYVDHPIKNECTFDEHEDGLWTLGFPGFSSYECESTKAKAVIMQELRFDVREKNPTEEVMVEGNKNITCTQKLYSLPNLNNDICEENPENVICEQHITRLDQSEINLFTSSVVLEKCRPDKTKKKYQCDICSKVFTHSSHLSGHKLIHAGIKKFQCNICSKKFTQSSHLSKHKLIHAGIKKFKCDICTKTFIQSSNLSNHKLIHAGIKKFKCDICSKTFTQPGNLSQHKLIHAGIKKFECDICNKRFIRSSDLSQHKLIHTEIKKFQCDVCNKKFLRSGDLSYHKLIHSNIKKFECDVCNKRFYQQKVLTQHKLIHSDIKKFKCDICSKSFTRSNALLQHKLIHAGINILQPDICNTHLLNQILCHIIH